MRSVTLKDVNAHKFINAYAGHLKKNGKIELPKWVDFVKTAHYKELPPFDDDWFYARCASLVRTIYLRPGSGMGALRRRYGGTMNRGTKTERKGLASKSVIRAALHQLESNGLVQLDRNGGRRITSLGQKECDKMAGLLIFGTKH